jgi:hypothetical protein
MRSPLPAKILALCGFRSKNKRHPYGAMWYRSGSMRQKSGSMRFHAVLGGSWRFLAVLGGTYALQIPLKNGSSGTPLGDFC